MSMKNKNVVRCVVAAAMACAGLRAACAVSGAGCAVRTTAERVELRNDYLSLTLSPGDGGTAVSLRDLVNGVEYATESIAYRMFIDRLKSYFGWFKCPYAVKVIENTPDAAEVSLTLTGVPDNPYLDIEKRFRLTRRSSALEVTYVYHNRPEAMAKTVIEPWFRISALPRGGKEQMTFLPTEGGVKTYGVNGGDTYPPDLIGGWLAGGDGAGRTMAVEFDYARLDKPYLALEGLDQVTQEWWFTPVEIAEGKSWSTKLRFYPARGIGWPDWCENGFAAEFGSGKALDLKVAGARAGTYAAVLEATMRDGSEKRLTRSLRLGPKATAEWQTGLRTDDLKSAMLTLSNAGVRLFAGTRHFQPGIKYRACAQKAKPAEVKPYELKLSDAVKSPSVVPFAKPWAGGRTSALFVLDLRQQREAVELAQRMDLDPRAIRIAAQVSWNGWCMADRFGHFTFQDSNHSLKKELEKDVDAIVVSGSLWKIVDRRNQEEILRKVASGKTGLVIIEDASAVPADYRADAGGTDYITRAIPAELLPNCAGKVFARSKGDSRIVFCDYKATEGLTPYFPVDYSYPDYRYEEYSLALMARAILWASKRDLQCPADARVESRTVEPRPGFRIEHIRHLDKRGVVDFECKVTHRQMPAVFSAFRVTTNVVEIGRAVEGVYAPASAEVELTLTDGYGRLLDRVRGKDGRFSLDTMRALTGLVKLRAELCLNGTPCDVRTQEIVCHRPYREPDFMFQIGGDSVLFSPKRYIQPLRARLLTDYGINQYRFWGVPYDFVSDRYVGFGYDVNYSVARMGLHPNEFKTQFLEPYEKTKDKRHLCRKPCYHDPDYVKRSLAEVADKIRRTAKYSPTSYDCGDECSLTMWTVPFDFCFCEATLRHFRTWLRGEYRDLKSLNARWDTRFESWDDVVPDTTDEARERFRRTGHRNHGAWADHRRVMELAFCGYAEKVREVMRRLAPGVPLDMSGTQPPTGWTGMDMWLLSKSVDICAAYDNEEVVEIVRSFGHPLVKPWYGYNGGGEAVTYRVWHDALRLANFGINYYTESSFLMPDFTLPWQTKGLLADIADLQCGAARLLRSLETDAEVLIHYSQASIHAAQIEGVYKDFISARVGAVSELRACGVPFRFVSYEQLEKGDLLRDQAKKLVLPMSMAMSDAEIAAVRAFARSGGKVYGDEHAGELDEHCNLRSAVSPLKDIVRVDRDFGGERTSDGIRSFRYRSRDGHAGIYYGFVRALDVKGVGERTVRLKNPACVYETRSKKCHGRVGEFTFRLPAGKAMLFAALPYEVKRMSLSAPATVRAGAPVAVDFRLETSDPATALHPVRIEVVDPSGKPCRHYSGMADAVGGKGGFAFVTALDDVRGAWRVIATDYVSGKRAEAAFAVSD